MQVFCGTTGFEDTLQGNKCPSCGKNVIRKYTEAWYDHTVEGVR
jgi:rubredoxin